MIEIVKAEGARAAAAAPHIPDLVHATGPQSYDYIFGGRQLCDPFIAAAWTAPGNFFSHRQSVLAFEDGVFRGVLISHDGPDHYKLKDAVWPVALALVDEGRATEADIRELAARAEIASFMNPHVPEDCSYIIVVSVQEARARRGRRSSSMKSRAKAKGFSVHLDVMSDNRGGLYRAMGFERWPRR